MGKDIQRLFFAGKVTACWPEISCKGKIVQEELRHITLDFLGSTSLSEIKKILPNLPLSNFLLSPCGWFSSCKKLHNTPPYVIAWIATWFSDVIYSLQKTIHNFLEKNGYSIDHRKWLPHMTICRDPQSVENWITSFQPLSFYVDSIHLYESLGNSTYQSKWSYPLHPPFSPLEHTADLAFIIFGKTTLDLYYNAFCALCFECKDFIGHHEENPSINSLDDIIILLNEALSYVDSTVGCPFKAVSFHGKILFSEKNLLQWTMIIDV